MENTIFKLIKIEYCDEKPQYPEFEVNSKKLGYFSSLEKAEQAMKENIEQFFNSETDFGYWINEHVIDKTVYCAAKSRRSYLPDGSFWDETMVTEIENENVDLEIFSGRPVEKIRFKAGDLVEVFSRDWVFLGIVNHAPRTPEEVKRCRIFAFDYSSDWYDTMSPDGSHWHTCAASAFPLRFPVSDELRKKLKNKFLEYRNFDNGKQ